MNCELDARLGRLLIFNIGLRDKNCQSLKRAFEWHVIYSNKVLFIFLNILLIFCMFATYLFYNLCNKRHELAKNFLSLILINLVPKVAFNCEL